MLLIFDLDDTLIDTSGSIVPFRMEQILHAMVEQGLEIPSLEKALEQLNQLYFTAASSTETIELFLRSQKGDLKFLEIAKKILLSTPLPNTCKVRPLEKVKEFLQEMYLSHKLAVVTIGSEALQLEKLEKAGIDRSLFCKIVVSEQSNKKKHYEQILETFSFAPEDALVCGDRVSIDLIPAKQLGMHTVHMRWGRGARYDLMGEYIDFSVTGFKEVKKIIEQVMR